MTRRLRKGGHRRGQSVRATWRGLVPPSARRRLAAAFLALGCAWPGVAAAKRTVAVVVGNNLPPPGASGEGLATLRYADDDAHRYADLFKRVADQTILLTVYDQQTRRRVQDAGVDGPPTLAALRKTLRAIREDEDLTVYLVFSGHGAIDETGAPFLSLLDGPLTRDVLFDELLAALPADHVHLIIDACHAAGVVGIRGDRFAREIDGTTSAVTEDEEERWAKERTLARFPHVGVLASSSAGESSHEWSVLEAGVFSHEVLSGLSGAADINEDKRIEYSEVQSFVASANRSVSDPRAKPSVVVHPPALDPHQPLVDLGAIREAALLHGDLSSLGHFHVELADGRRYLDGHVGGPVTLALPPGQLYLRAGELEYPLVLRAGETVAFDQLEARAASDTARGSVAASYRQQLFAEPYTYDYYRGYVDSVGALPVSTPVPAPAVVARRRSESPADAGPQSDGPSRARSGGIALVTVSAITGVTALGTGISAGVLRSRFSNAQNERDAADYVDPHRQRATVAVAMAVVSGVTGVLGALLLRRARSRTNSGRAGSATARLAPSPAR